MALRIDSDGTMVLGLEVTGVDLPGTETGATGVE